MTLTISGQSDRAMKPTKSSDEDPPPPQDEYAEEPNPAGFSSRDDDESATRWESGSERTGSMISG
jgi:hypothetical protein